MEFQFIRKALLGVILLVAPASAMEVTVYNNNLALIKEQRSFTLNSGLNEIRAAGVATRMDPTSVHFKSLTAPEAITVLEQNFQYDLISENKLLERYLGKEIELERFLGVGGEKKEIIRGKLLSNAGSRILDVGGKIYVNPPGHPILPELPEGLLTKPTLLWKIDADKEGAHNCEISYLTEGMGWRADYILATDATDERLDLNAWVSINNNSGAAYKEAKLKLVAGEIHRAPQEPSFELAAPAALGMGAPKGARGAPQFVEQPFFEYHLYTLARPTALRENETKQIEMAQATDVPMKKLFIYDGAEGVTRHYSEYSRHNPNYGAFAHNKVTVVLEFKNAKENNLGLPLPQGRVRVYKEDSDGSLEFIGEDAIDHTPKDEKVRVIVGDAFDLIGERKRMNFQADKKWCEETFEITLKNHKETDALITVVEHLYRWSNWKILNASMPWTKKDAQTIEFQAPVKKDEETTISYTVKYSW